MGALYQEEINLCMCMAKEHASGIGACRIFKQVYRLNAMHSLTNLFKIKELPASCCLDFCGKDCVDQLAKLFLQGL